MVYEGGFTSFRENRIVFTMSLESLRDEDDDDDRKSRLASPRDDIKISGR